MPTRAAPPKPMASATAPIPRDADAALRYGLSLRATGPRAQAVAVLEQGSIAHPTNKAMLAAYGRALSDNGSFQQAFDVLGRAHSPDNPDWRILSVQGTALDQMGRHEEARRYYASALQIAPNEPSVLSNVGIWLMSLEESAESRRTLRQAQATGRADGRVQDEARRSPSACRAVLRKPRPSRRATCRPTRPPPTSPI